MQKPGLFGMNGFMVFLLTCFSVAAHGQQPGYLILIDAESKQAFTVLVGSQLYPSTGHGHLVLSQLKDSTYKLNLRFPKKNINDQVFTIAIHQKDLGFLLKGTDSSWVLYNWQTGVTLCPVYEKDSSRMLDQGVKRDDGFSRLMAAVVNDTAVMYNTYAGNGFNHDSSTLIAQSTSNTQRLTPETQRPSINGQSPRPDTLISAIPPSLSPGGQSELPPIASGQQPFQQFPPTTNDQRPTVNKDSLLAVKRQEIYLKDSLNTARKSASRDSLIAARKQQTFLKDSLNTARRAAVRDSLVIVKKQQSLLKDSLIVARKAMKDSLLAAKKAGGSKDSLMIVQKMQESNDSLLAVNKQNALRDSLLAVSKSNALKDSLVMLNAQRSTVNGQLPTKMAPGIKKLREVSLKISRKMVFLDISKDGQADTITLFVYFETSDTLNKNQAGGQPLVVKKPLPPDSTEAKKSQLKNKNSDTTGLSRILAKSKNSDTTELSKALVKKPPSKPADATVCGQIATEADTQSLRSAILKANSEQEKISVASGIFALKCFSVSQVRLLASLLVSDKAKYRLMDAAHLHISDRDHFPELVDMLTDKNFQRKFLEMAEKRS
jgi:hypothetical protein